ncbi:response regulator [Azospirillum agricola]|uniref:response regulator n=1 Tax=Azospirillum agricola TaxID=1720247 RepID=UPI000A0EEFB8|nr:response regulator [Azospirillum agricola]SMH53432.1 Response regulator receiver domain-containing protein [Azospirillum lipoferum]
MMTDDPPTLPHTPRVLIVEDESLAAMALEEILGMLGYEVCGTADNAEDAIMAAERQRPDIVMMDIRLHGPRDGIETAAAIRARFGIRSIFMSAFGDPDTRRRAEDCQPFGFVKKPYFPNQLDRVLADATQQLALVR